MIVKISTNVVKMSANVRAMAGRSKQEAIHFAKRLRTYVRNVVSLYFDPYNTLTPTQRDVDCRIEKGFVDCGLKPL